MTYKSNFGKFLGVWKPIVESKLQDLKGLSPLVMSLIHAFTWDNLKLEIHLENQWKKEKKSLHRLNINTYNKHYDRLNECNDIIKMPKTNCTDKAPSKAAICWKLKGLKWNDCFLP